MSRGHAAGLLLFAAVTGCTSELDEAKRQYEMIAKAGGDARELCAAARRVEAEALKSGSEAEYKLERVQSALDCNEASLDRLVE